MKVKDAAVAYKTRKKIYAYDDLLKTPEDGKRYEIINGELHMSAAPFVLHQAVSANLFELLREFVKKNRLGKVFYAPLDVVLSDSDVVQPDILFVSHENFAIIEEKNLKGSPDLVIEILSPSTAYNDMFEKKELYEHYGVHEYWIVDPKRQWIEIFVQNQGKLTSVAKTGREGEIKSSVLAGLKPDLNEVFLGI